MKAHAAPNLDRAGRRPGGSSGSNIKHTHDTGLYSSDQDGPFAGEFEIAGRGGTPTNGDSIRAMSWDDPLLYMDHERSQGDGTYSGPSLPSPGIKFVHDVPESLRHIGCMWLPDGREDRRCGRSPAWTMGANLNIARVYCETHGRLIELRRAQIRALRTLRRRAAG